MDSAECVMTLSGVSNLAEIFDIPVQSIYVWRSQGEGPPGIRIGCHLRFRPEDVDDWLARQRGRSTDPVNKR